MHQSRLIAGDRSAFLETRAETHLFIFFYFFFSFACLGWIKHIVQATRKEYRFALEISISAQLKLSCDFGREYLE